MLSMAPTLAWKSNIQQPRDAGGQKPKPKPKPKTKPKAFEKLQIELSQS